MNPKNAHEGGPSKLCLGRGSPRQHFDVILKPPPRRAWTEQAGLLMKTYDLSELALRNLRESSLRNSLTTIGISVGVAWLVGLL